MSVQGNTRGEASHLVIMFYSSWDKLPQLLGLKGSLVLHRNSEALQSLTLDLWSGMPKDFLLLAKMKEKKWGLEIVIRSGTLDQFLSLKLMILCMASSLFKEIVAFVCVCGRGYECLPLPTPVLLSVRVILPSQWPSKVASVSLPSFIFPLTMLLAS